jgi:vacuolar-type H+-ATPase subunit I/STV1
MIEVIRISPLTGNINKMYLDITQEQIQEWNKPAQERRLIQDIFPNLNDDEREFIMTGYTPADWKNL